MNKYKKIFDKCSNYNLTPPILEKVPRIIVFGDIHGDYELACILLKKSKLAMYENNKWIWIGQNTILVQVGDQVDRCRPVGILTCENPETTKNDKNDDIKILDLFTDLHNQAIKKGGRVISLLGNHEILNALGIMDYVSYKGQKEFKYKGKSGVMARREAFMPKGDIATLLGCTRLPSVIIGSNLFVHAGLVDKFITDIEQAIKKDNNKIKINKQQIMNYFEQLNITIREWLLGMIDVEYVYDIITAKNSIFWTRILGTLPSNVSLDDPICSDNLKKVLKIFKLNGMIIGHTPQSFINNSHINATCDNKIWRVDIGSSCAFDLFDAQLLKSKNYIQEYSNSETSEYKITNYNTYTVSQKINKYKSIKSSHRTPQYLEILNDNKYIVHI